MSVISVIKSVRHVKPFVTQGAGRSVLVLKKYSPEILTAVGIAGTVASTILTARATLKVEPIIDKINDDLDTAKELRETAHAGEYTDVQFTKDKTAIYTRGAIDLVKLYGPSASLLVFSVGCIIGGHGILQRRNVAALASFKALETTFAEYRKRVESRLGPEEERDIKVGVESVQVEGPDGKIKPSSFVDPNKISMYARFFDELNPNWSPRADQNLVWLKAHQQYANDLLLLNGYLLLNDVYDMLGMDRSTPGALVGWIVGKGSDNFVDFGIYDFADQRRAFVNGQENAILLDFNVDGVVYDKIDKFGRVTK